MRQAGRCGPLYRTSSVLGLALGATLAAWSSPARAQEPASCLSFDPSQWPSPSKPYFMLAVDTSGSMFDPVAATNSCAYPNNRLGHARCAVKNMLFAFAGEVNFGLATFAMTQNNCTATCFNGCTHECFPGDTGPGCSGCGPRPGDPTTRAGANLVVPMLQDHFWSNPPSYSNVPELLKYVDNACGDSKELFGAGGTPLNGILRDMKRYFLSSWTSPDGARTYATPLSASDRAGAGVNGSTGCRSVNVVLITDGDESCDTHADAVNAATDLYQNGVSVGGKTYKIRVFVINFAGGSIANSNQIASAGGTGASYQAQNEAQLSSALADIVGGAIKPEVCDNTDNNCNGCTDEGYRHHCNTNQVCCVWNNTGQRDLCLTNYKATITPGNPQGDLTKLPCTTPAQKDNPATWLCYDPKDKCDDVDNNCQDGVDEGAKKCGTPLHCPQTDVCDGEDNDCNGVVNDLNGNGVPGSSCPVPCNPSSEICDGCDNDCNGIVDDGVNPVPCGLSSPPACSGTQSCALSGQSVQTGGCLSPPPGGFWTACNNSTSSEVCDGVDNDCDGLIDDGIPAQPCTPPGTPPDLVYGPPSQCTIGQQPCNGTCGGFSGPSPEICDGVDNDCDGTVDEDVFGVGNPCGNNQSPCVGGNTACLNGVLTCEGGQPPKPEVCDGIDNDCDGVTDDAPLEDGPPPGQGGCWQVAGNCCSFKNLTWCPPPGATCNDTGSLATPPCKTGQITCAGAAGFVCQGGVVPSGEVCDAVDNDCNGTPDDGVPNLGSPCGDDAGECELGQLACKNGLLVCDGEVGPKPEECNGKDDDCDGFLDNGIPTGGPCTPDYDGALFPNAQPDKGICKAGVFQCDGAGGLVCLGGVGPSAELCDGVDNDCDGKTDELAAPGEPPTEGVGGTENPFPPPAGKIGEPCGSDVGECALGTWSCLNGLFVCQGGVSAAPEECDCLDNDCDGQTDEDPEVGGGTASICGESATGKKCVVHEGFCQCSEPCDMTKEFVCPAGDYKCADVVESSTQAPLEDYCVKGADSQCPGGCTTKTVKDSGNNVQCAPAGTILPGCYVPPVCACKFQDGCQEPCFGVVCTAPLVCTKWGPKAGTCVPNNCYQIPCAGCGSICSLGECKDNPCHGVTCPPGEFCKPDAALTGYSCETTCAAGACPSGQVCLDGACVPGCSPPCVAGEVCDPTTLTCVPSQCGSDPCPDGGFCDPWTGACGDDPCAGVICPGAATCVLVLGQAQCVEPTVLPDAGAGGAAGGSPEGFAPAAKPIFGLPTGGGGLSCAVGSRAAGGRDGGLAWWALAALLALRSRRVRDARRARSAAPSRRA